MKKLTIQCRYPVDHHPEVPLKMVAGISTKMGSQAVSDQMDLVKIL